MREIVALNYEKNSTDRRYRPMIRISGVARYIVIRGA